MTQGEFESLKEGDIVTRKANKRALVVTVTNRGYSSPDTNVVIAQNVKDGKPFGRGYTVTLSAFDKGRTV